jgi:ABC-type amino acid transport substrate-binding protein
MKPFHVILTAALVAIVAAYGTVKMMVPKETAVTNASAKKETTYERVMRTKTLRCSYAVLPPMISKDVNTGKLSGVDYDVWEQIGKLLDLKIEWVEEVGWGNFIEGLRTNRYDMFCNQIWADPTRTKYLSLSSPVLYYFLQTYVRADDHRFDGNLEKINDPSVTVPAIEGDVTVMMAKSRVPKAKLLLLTQTAPTSDMFMSVVTKKADAYFQMKAIFDEFEKENPGKLRPLENVPPSFVFASYYSFNTGDYQLRDMVNIALRALIDSGQMEKIAHSYSPDYIIAKKNYGEGK